MPRSFSLSVTSSAPMFLSAIIWMASKTVASGEMDQTVVPFWVRISLIVPIGFMAESYHGQLRKTGKNGFLDISSGWAMEYSCAPFPLTPTPLLGERVGVKENEIHDS